MKQHRTSTHKRFDVGELSPLKFNWQKLVQLRQQLTLSTSPLQKGFGAFEIGTLGICGALFRYVNGFFM